MGFIRDTYRSISFRGRLLLLLVVISAVQAGIAAYTFNQLRAQPVDDRVRAQLNSNLRAAAPVMDAESERVRAKLEQLRGDTDLAAAVDADDRSSMEQIIGATASASGGTDEAGSSVEVDSLGADAMASTGDATADDGAAGDQVRAYMTSPTGEIIAGERPDGVLVEQEGLTSTKLVRDSDGALMAVVHVPIVLDEKFMKDRMGGYIHGKGMKVFVTDGKHMVSSSGTFAAPRHVTEGLHTITVRGTSVLSMSQRLLDGDVRIVSTIPTSVIAVQKRRSVSSLVGFIFVLFTLTVFESFMITRSVGDALRVFARNARQLADGDLTQRIPVTGHDEVADLSSSFNEMASNLEERIEHLTEARVRMRRQVDLFGEALANTTAVNEMLQAVCALAIESTSATHSRFWLFDETEGNFTHAACIGLRPGDTEPCGLERAVAVRNAAVRSEGEPWWLIVPARTGDRIIGLLTLVSTMESFDTEDVRLAERLAIQAAVAIDNARMHEQLKLQATRDGLTGLPNHRALQDALHDMLDEAQRRNMPLGVALLDIDNFKRINDMYGHHVGDEAIKSLGKVLEHGIGGMGMAARYGGEEFVVLMPGCDAGAACRIADRIREDVSFIEVPLEDGGVLTFTASIGVANVDQNQRIVDNAALLQQADTGLYNAKRTGKNRVMLAGPDTVVVEMGAAEKAALEARERGETSFGQAA